MKSRVPASGQRPPSQAALRFTQELCVDLFAGGGGASLGIARAYREPDVAVNHDPVACAVHRANHPSTRHFTCDVFEVDPVAATQGRPVGLLWASPDCRHHSKAKGGKPRSKRVRALAWVVVKWAKATMPRCILLENVEEFAAWGPLLKDGQPCPMRKGFTYRRWVRELEKLGYKVESREIRACDLGAPTIRKRLYIVARRDGLPIVWPEATHHRGNYRTAAECIDWSLPCNSLFLPTAEAKKLRLKRPLEVNTLKRIVKGVFRYTIDTDEPFIVPLRGTSSGHTSTHGVHDPLSTVSGQGTHHALVEPFLTEHANASTQRTFAADQPLRTQCANVKGGHFALATATLIEAAHSAESPSGVKRWGSGIRDLNAPLGTVQAGGGNFAISTASLSGAISAHITKFRANSIGASCEGQMPTVTAGGDMQRPAGAAHALGVVEAHLTKFRSKSFGADLLDPHPTITSGANSGIVEAVFIEQANSGPRTGRPADEPLSTITTSGNHQQIISAAFIEQANTDMVGHHIEKPLSTIVGKGCTQRLVAVQLLRFRREICAAPQDASSTMARSETVAIAADTLTPAQWRTASACAALLRKYAPERFPEATGEEEVVVIGDRILADLGMRMLTPRELARAQGFPDSYVIEFGVYEDGTRKRTTKTQQVKLIGNSVCPDVAEALVRENLRALVDLYAQAAAG